MKFEQCKNRTDEWYTPKWIIDALVMGEGKFDLDPCSPPKRLFEIAGKYYTKEDNGLTKEWRGNVWLNPPYSRKLVVKFIEKLAKHGKGIALLFNRMDTALWHDVIFPTADAMLIMRGRVKFIDSGLNGRGGATSGSILVAWGKENAECLRKSAIEGKYIEL